MAFKLKGSAFYGHGNQSPLDKSAMKHADPGGPHGKAKQHSHANGELHNTAGEVIQRNPDSKVLGVTAHDMDHSYQEGTPKKHTHGEYSVTEATTAEERADIARRMEKDKEGK